MSAAVSAWNPPAGAIGADRLLARITSGPGGHLSLSIYETARLVRLAPWLWGHHARIDYLMARQQRDGTWGGPGLYALVPTLSATEALLRLACAQDRPSIRAERRTDAADLLATAAERGLQALHHLLGGSASARLPDTLGADTLVPYLIGEINRRLCRCDRPQAAHRRLRRQPPLPAPHPDPASTTPAPRQAAPPRIPGTQAMAGHLLEASGEMGDGVHLPSPGDGLVAGSPAATAAWIARRGGDARAPRCAHRLDHVARRHGGPVSSLWTAAEFDQAQVVAALARGGLAGAVPPTVRDALRRSIARGATGLALGLPGDCETTSTMLYALNALHARTPLELLEGFETATHFQRWPGEPLPSTVTNAHVLEAVGSHIALHPQQRPRYAPTIAKVARWLYSRQNRDGHWDDPWHASPYYATHCAAVALGRYGDASGNAAVARAVQWVHSTQRPDGSWGIWNGTAEETACALQTIMAAPHHVSPAPLVRGATALQRLTSAGGDHPPLWRGKELCAPTAIIDAVIVAARHRLRTRPQPGDRAHDATRTASLA
ncbi:prenyltransferase/squalene oxidase repeat-containing protein [Actinomadura rugatobispora]|uniref:Prenyltransferase/squalene oxidase repeat-containing protein n=1 Tax=Actinomadura rugatobispora TaxID=1994 RepID=A0ABW0ZVT1_9ACTN|nr:type B diterpene cyclase [Actinomadura rugatobispora]